jgi:queuine tRNA-ribosyltransferase
MLTFTTLKKDPKTLARRGELKLYNGTVQTPAFMPVGTVGAVKTLLPQEVKSLGADIILGNTYHLYLRPGHEQIKEYGGIQKWNHWDGPVLTDSGGFQVFSLGGKNRVTNETPAAPEGAETSTPADQPLRSTKPVYDADDTDAGLVKIVEEGVHFTSHLDGSKHFFSPENVVDIQTAIGSDIMMVLDECTEFPATYDRAKKSMERTHRWAKRAVDYFAKLKEEHPEIAAKHNLFGIAQGSTFKELREESTKFISEQPFDGVAVGGVSVGEGKDYMYEVMQWTGPLLPEEKPHYLMGIGEPEDLIQGVANGYDMFDCVLPTRLGRYGVIWRAHRDSQGRYEKFEKWDMRSKRFRNDQSVMDPHCTCPTCSQGFSAGFIDHMLREREVVGIRLTTMHNLHTLLQLMRDIRSSLENGSFTEDFTHFIAQ